MSKLREDLSIGLLGAAAGLLSSSVTLLINRIDAYYAYVASIEEDRFYSERAIRALWWILPTFWHILLSVVAACLVHALSQESLQITVSSLAGCRNYRDVRMGANLFSRAQSQSALCRAI